MCWSLEASAGVAAVGFAAAGVAAAQKQPPAIWLTLGYFSLMEALQAATYPVADACGTSANRAVTLLAYLHIAFQPFFINLISMHFVPSGVRVRIAPAVYALCLGSALYMLAQIAPFAWAPRCPIGDTLCGDRFCAVSGTWHIGWEIPFSAFGFAIPFPSYLLAGFVLPILYGSWRMTLFHFVTGPAAAYLSTDDPNEWPAIWCLYSVGLILIVVMTPLRHKLAVRRWFWPERWLREPDPGRAPGRGVLAGAGPLE